MKIHAHLTTAVFVATSVFAENGSLFPVRELTASQKKVLVSGGNHTKLTLPTLSTAAHVKVTALGHGTDTMVQRANGAVSAVQEELTTPHAYAVGMPATTAEPAPTGFDFKKSGDSARAWATMRSTGSPFIALTSYGKSDATGMASFSGKITMASTQNVYLIFRVPAVTMGGAHEQEGPSRRQARARVEILLNGASIWSSEGVYFNKLASTPSSASNCNQISEQTTFLSLFERPMLTNTAETVYLNLGQFATGETLDLTLMAGAEVQTLDRCCTKKVNGVDELFCSSTTARVAWDSSVEPVRIYTGPQIQ
ncbi:MAG: hypothetical protein FJW40_26460 [Acidobacteria bacterium]|nr:hypothetical protein [Acidobacteriota bacterium]